MHRLEVVGQTIISAAEIKSLVFDACTEIPITGDEEAMRETDVIVKRIPVTKVVVGVVVVTAERVVHFIVGQIKVVSFGWRGRGCPLIGRCPRNPGGGGRTDL